MEFDLRFITSMYRLDMHTAKLNHLMRSGLTQEVEKNIYRLTMQTLMEISKAQRHRGEQKMPSSFSLTGTTEYSHLPVPQAFTEVSSTTELLATDFRENLCCKIIKESIGHILSS